MRKNKLQLYNNRTNLNKGKIKSYIENEANELQDYDIDTLNNSSFAPREYYKYIPYEKMLTRSDNEQQQIKGDEIQLLPIQRKLKLTEEQYNIAMLFLSGKLWNIYIGGDAGTGKTVVTEYIIANLENYYRHQIDDQSYYDSISKDSKLKKKITGDNKVIHYLELKIGLTGSMGVTAVNVKGEYIKGETVHSRVGIFKASNDMDPKELANIIGNQKREEIRETEVLIIDECFILNSTFFELINRLYQLVCGNEFPFGGKRLILVGDPNQLGPIDDRSIDVRNLEISRINEWNRFSNNNLINNNSDYDDDNMQDENILYSQKETEEVRRYRMEMYIFESKSWDDAIGNRIGYLTQIMRQDINDIRFIEFLKKTKMGTLTLDDKKWFIDKTIMKTKEDPTEIETDITKRISDIQSDTVVLYNTNYSVNNFNLLKLANLGTRGRIYNALDEKRNTKITTEPPYPEKLVLKLTTPVMLLKNMIKIGLYNGSKGYVIGFQDKTHFPWVYFPSLNKEDSEKMSFPEPTEQEQYKPIEDFILDLVKVKRENIFLIKPITWKEEKQNIKLISRTQLPLKVNWASTIHKAQGLTLYKIIIDPSEQRQPGSFYTSITRVRSMDNIVIFSKRYNTLLKYEDNSKLYDKLINPQVLINIVQFDQKSLEASKQNLKLFQEEQEENL